MDRRSFQLSLKLFFLSAFLLILTNPLKADEEEAINFATAVEQVAQKVGPTVVSIKTEKVEHVRGQPFYFGAPYEDEMLNRFFEDFFGNVPESEYRRRGLGSGVIIDPRGFILTNA